MKPFLKPLRSILLFPFVFVLAVSGLMFPMQGFAQSYPDRPVKIVVSLSPGATNDLIARSLAQKLGELFKNPFFVENKPGGNGTIAAAYVAKESPDGHTLLLGNTSTLGIQPSLFTNLSYDPVKDFQSIALVAESPIVMVVNANLPVKNLKEFIAYAKAHPNQVAYGSPGAGSPFHLTGELLNLQTDIRMLHVPYKGAAPALVDLLGGQIQVMFDNPPNVLNQIKNGRLRALCVTSSSRIPQLPEVPTTSEAGFPSVQSTSFFALVGPKGMNPNSVNVLSSKVAEAMKDPQIQSQLIDLGAIPKTLDATQTTTYIDSQVQKWARVIKTSGIKADQ
jgi:tripartite-type tricarboxylate transporter receptor subunit TctC